MTFDAPFRFDPIYQARVWGGRRLQSMFGRALPESVSPCGESWEISDRPEAQSLVVDSVGLTLHDLWTRHRRAVFGGALAEHPAERFPLLMKILDACDDLSIQVHPPATVAAELGGEPKTEVWFIAHADPGARLYVGVKPGVTRAAFEQAIHHGTVADLVQVIEPRRGDCLFIPSGRLHAIGKGLVIFEIQQNSDTTYRVFDWNRLGLDGRPRALHVRESLQCIDFNDTCPALQEQQPDGTLVRCEFFDVRLAQGRGVIGRQGEMVIVVGVSGSFSCGGTEIHPGDFFLLPADMSAEARAVAGLTANAAWLEVRIPV